MIKYGFLPPLCISGASGDEALLLMGDSDGNQSADESGSGSLNSSDPESLAALDCCEAERHYELR